MGWYYVITDEIRNTFEGKEADVFAVINGYSQEGQGCFYGSLATLSEFCGIKSKTTTQKFLKSLEAKGAIIKKEEFHNGVKTCSYRVSENWYGISKIDMGCTNDCDGGISEIDTNNKEKNINIDNNSLLKENKRFLKPTLEEIISYCHERGNKIDPEQFYNYYESNGWMIGKARMRDWRASIRTWEKRQMEYAPKVKKESTKRESVLEHNLKVMDQMYGTHMHAQAYGKKEETIDEQ